LPPSRTDRLVFWLANLFVYLTRPFYALRCRRHLSGWPNFATPRYLGELVQWRKVIDRNPAFVTFADKLATKDWIAARLPGVSMAETVWVGERPEDIPDALLAEGYVIKTNNASGQNYLPHRGALTRAEVNRKFRRWLRASEGRRWLGWLDQRQEWAYLPVPPRVFVEKKIGEDQQLVDIAVRVMNGVPQLVSCALDFKTDDSKSGYFWPDGTPLDDPAATKLPSDFTVPPAFDQAIRHAALLGQGFDYLRIDFLAAGEALYAGEITCYPASGFGAADEWFFRFVYRRWLDTLHLSWPLATPQGWPQRVYLAAFRRWLDRRRAELRDTPLR